MTHIRISYEKLQEGLVDTIGAILVLAALVGVAHCGVGCRPSQTSAAIERSYEAAIVACAATSGYPKKYDRATDMACRASVDCVYKVGPCGDR